MAEAAPPVTLASLADLVAALRAVLPPIVGEAVRAELKRRDLPPWLSPAHWSAAGGLSVATVRRRVADGTLVSKKVGGRVLVSTASLNTIDEVAIARAAMKAVVG